MPTLFYLSSAQDGYHSSFLSSLQRKNFSKEACALIDGLSACGLLADRGYDDAPLFFPPFRAGAYLCG